MGSKSPDRPSPRSPSSGLRAAALLIALAAAANVAVAALVTGWTLVDDAYVTLRYARNLALHGELVYNLGEPAFGVSSPLWAFFTAGLVALFPGALEQAVVVTGIVAWSLAAWVVALASPARVRLATVVVFLLAPSFVDGQMLGLETPLFVFLLLAAARAAQRGRPRACAAFTGLVLVCRPEGLLFAAVLAGATFGSIGASAALRQLTRPAVALLAFAPVVAWGFWATSTYGSPIPRPVLAGGGWTTEHYASLDSYDSLVSIVPRLTFLPFVDHLHPAAAGILTGLLLAGLGWIAVRNATSGSAWSRAALATYLALVAVHLARRGAPEASWYSLPPSVALLLAAAPAIPGRLAGPRPAWTLAVVLALSSGYGVARRAPLLKSHAETQRALARELNLLPDALPADEHRVLLGEIGAFGFASNHRIVDVRALVSPEVLAWREDGETFLGVARRSGVSFFVIGDAALESNCYPTVGRVWDDEAELEWLYHRCRLVSDHGDRRLYQVRGARYDEPLRPKAR